MKHLDWSGWLNRRVVATVLLTKAVILLFGAQAFRTVNDLPINAQNSFLGIWVRWDATHYLNIAANGYAGSGEERFLIVFFPLYPALVTAVSVITRSHLFAAFFVSGIASVALGLTFRRLVRLDHGEKTAQAAVLFLFIFPTSYFLHIPYTESLFLTLAVASFLAAREKYWASAGILAALACLTRINGLILIPALALEAWEEYRETRRINPGWLFLAVIPIGFGIYLILNYWVAGDPLIFLTYQREHWSRYFRWPWEGVWEAFKRVNGPTPNSSEMLGVQESIFVIIGFSAMFAGWKYLRNSYRIWMFANCLLFVSTSFVMSVPRYTLTLFPLFLLMAVAARKYENLKLLMILWSLLNLALFTTQFVRGWWAF